MPKLPKLKGRELIKILRRNGFVVLRVKGCHHFLRHADGRCTVVPVHAGETLGPGLAFADSERHGIGQGRLGQLNTAITSQRVKSVAYSRALAR